MTASSPLHIEITMSVTPQHSREVLQQADLLHDAAAINLALDKLALDITAAVANDIDKELLNLKGNYFQIWQFTTFNIGFFLFNVGSQFLFGIF